MRNQIEHPASPSPPETVVRPQVYRAGRRSLRQADGNPSAPELFKYWALRSKMILSCSFSLFPSLPFPDHLPYHILFSCSSYLPPIYENISLSNHSSCERLWSFIMLFCSPFWICSSLCKVACHGPVAVPGHPVWCLAQQGASPLLIPAGKQRGQREGWNFPAPFCLHVSSYCCKL